jgi:alanine racemase
MSSRPTRAIISLTNLEANFRSIRNFLGDGPVILCVVKADAYGHGAIACSKRLEKAGTDWLGVALPEEGFELRNAGIRTPILAMGSFWSGQEESIIEKRITPAIFNMDVARALDSAAGRLGVTVSAHLKVDTGMGRIGVLPEQIPVFAAELKQLRNVRIDGLMTHLAAADDLSQSDYTEHQNRLFNEAADVLNQAGHSLKCLNVANSPGAIAHPASRHDMVRIGGILYGRGVDVLPPGIPAPELLPVMSIVSEIAHIKEVPKGVSLGYGRTFSTDRPSVIATVPIGYHDGLPRSLSNKGDVLVRGKRAPIAGRISMDWTIVDVTDIGGVSIGDRVTVLGTDGDESIGVEEIARHAGTISYEITCGIHGRARREYA